MNTIIEPQSKWNNYIFSSDISIKARFHSIVILFSFLFILLYPELNAQELIISKTGPSTANPGDIINYTITYQNTSSDFATDVEIKDILPSNLFGSLISSNPAGISDGITITWTSAEIPDLAKLDNKQYSIEVQFRVGLPDGSFSPDGFYIPSSPITLENYAQIKSNEITTPVESNKVETNVAQLCDLNDLPPLVAEIKSSGGSYILQLIPVTNKGNVYDRFKIDVTDSTLSNIVLDKQILDINGISITGAPGVGAPTEPVTYTTDWLAPGETVFFFIKLIVDQASANKYNYTNITLSSIVCNSVKKTTQTTFIQNPKHPYIFLLKTSSPATVLPGDTLTYSLIVYNNNNNTVANGVVLTETYPSGTTFLSANPMPDIGNNTWNIGDMAEGSIKEVVISVKIDASNLCADQTIVNTAIANYTNNLSDPIETTASTIMQSTPLAISGITSSNITCNGFSDGTVTATATGVGVIHYKLLFSAVSGGIYSLSPETNGDTDGSYTGLAPGFYKVRITDECPLSFTPIESTEVYVAEPAILSATGIELSAVSCFGGNDGSATITPSGGTEPYTITHSPTALAAGTTTFTVTDANLCTATVDVNITEPAAALSASITSQTNVLCPGDATGEIDLTITGGTSPYTFDWTTADGSGLINTDEDQTDLTDGTYDVLVTDANNCTTTATAVLTVTDTEKPVIHNIPDDVDFECSDCIQSFENNDFEEPVIPASAVYLSVLDSDISGWSTTAIDHRIEIQKSGGVDGVFSYSGNQHAELNGNNVGDLYQEFCTIPTSTVQISFAHHKRMAALNTSPDIMQVLCGKDLGHLNSLGTFTATNSSGWTVHTVNFYIPLGQNSTVFVFRAVQGAPSNPTYGNLIDDIRVVTLFDAANIPYATDNCAVVSFSSNEVRTEGITGGACVNDYQIVRTWTAVDASGNTSTATQTVTVGDLSSPEFTLPADLTISCTQNPNDTTITGNISSLIDNCDASPISFSYSDLISAGACPANYTITRTWTAVDHCLNETSKNQIITVKDTTKPTADNPTPILVQCASDVPASDISIVMNAADNCTSNPTVTWVSDLSDGLSCPETITRTYNVSDDCGNSTDITQIITVKDTTKPTASDPAPLFVDCNANIPPADIAVVTDEADNCTANPVVAWLSDVSDGLSCPETITRTYSVTDDCANQILVNQTIVVHDTIDPVITCPANISVNNDAGICGAIVTYSVNSSDNCSGLILTRTSGLASGSLFPTGTTTNAFLVTDPCGNSSTCNFDVVVTDNEDPTVITQNVTVMLDAAGNGSTTAALVDNGPNDACGIASLVLDRTDFTCADIATNPNTVTLTVEDNNGNTSSATALVTVVDNVAPVAIAQNLTVNLDATGHALIAAFAVDNGSNDACGIASLALDKTAFSCADIATNPNIVTLTVKDNNGKTATTTAQITIVDNVPPVAIAQNVTVFLDAAGNGSTTAALVDNGSNDACGIASLALDKTNFTCADIATNPNTVTLTVKDNNGNFSSTTAEVTVVDNVPPVAIAQNVTVFLDATGNGSTTPALVNNGSNDACGIASLALDKTAFTCADIAANPNIVTLTVTDIHTNTSTTTAQVTVVDNVPPVAIAQNVTVFLDATGNGSTTAALVNNGSNDACGIASLALDKTNFTCADIATNPNTVTLTVKDNNGNSSSTTAEVTVVDNVPPVAITQNVTVFLDAIGNGSTTPALVNNGSNDACGIASLALDKTAFTCADIAANPNIVTLTVTDIHTNTSTATAQVTVVDNVPPVAIAQNVTVFLDATGNGSTTAALVNNGSNDACGIASLALDKTNFTCADIATNPNTVTLTVKDNNGNSSSTTAQVTVVDNILPQAIAQNVTVFLDATGNGSTTAALVNNGSNDACGIASLALDKTAFTCADIAANPNIVTLTVTDIHTNTSTATAQVTVVDNVPPVAIAQNVTVYLDATGNGSTTAALVNNGSNDACGIASLALDNTDFTCANIATNPHPITLTVKDNNGNTSVANALVTVTDNVAPTALTKDITIQLSASGASSGTASIVASQVDNGSNDACGVASISVTPNAFTCSNVGPNTVTLTVEDKNGNISTKTATVTVEDNSAPIVLTKNITIQLDASGMASITASQVTYSSFDACGIDSMSVVPDTFSCPQVGANTVTLTVTDNNGNSTTKTAVVTVLDNIPPVAITQNLTVNLDVTGHALIAAFAVDNGSNDACGIASLALDKTTFSCADIATNPNTVTLTVTDNNGNTSSKTAQITIVDTIAPVALAKNVTVILDATGSGSTTAALVDNGSNDACGITSLVLDKTDFTCSDIAGNPNTVTLTVKDNNGNTSTATAQVTVVDNIPPVTIAQNVTVILDASGNGSTTAALVDNGSNDACGIASLVLDKTDFTCSDIAGNPNTVTLTATDNNGNTSSKTALVTVIDNVPPVAIAQNMTVNLDVTGQALISAFDIDNGSSDPCGIASLTLDKTAFSCADIATNPNTVTLTVKDNNGNTSTATAQVTVVDTILPQAIAQNVTVILDATGNGSTMAALVDNGSNDACGIASQVLDKTDFTCTDIATNPNAVTLTVTDNNGNTSSVTALVMVVDNILPQAIAQNVTVFLDGYGNGSTTAALVDNGSSDACGIASLALDKTDFTCADIATNPNIVTLTVTDNNGNTSTAAAQVTVLDTILPQAIAQNVSVFLDANGNGSTSAALVNNGSNDACGIASLSLNKTDFNCADVGENTVTLTVTDNNGNISTATAQVKVVDEIPPVALAHNVTIFLDATGKGSITAAFIDNGSNDACGIASLALDKTDFTCADIGGNPNSVTLTVTDNNSNTATVSAKVTVLDTTPPIVSEPADVFIEACSSADIGDPTVGFSDLAFSTSSVNISITQLNKEGISATDNCHIASITYSDLTNGGSCPEIMTRTFTITDDSGNSTVVDYTITIQDTSPPTASNPADMLVQCRNDAVIDIEVVTDEADNCTSFPLVEFYSDESDHVSCPETITRTYRITDNCENSIFVKQKILVRDTIKPTASNPHPIFVERIGDIPAPDTSVVFGISDNCSEKPLVQFVDDTPDGLPFLRTIYRRYSITDKCGNKSYVTQNININGFPYPNDDHYTIDENSKNNVFNVLENDDFGGDGPGKYGNVELKIEIVSEPEQGVAIVTRNPLNPDEQFIEYTPSPNYYQKDSFEYSIIDKSGDEATAMVFIDFIPNPLFIPEAFSPNGDGFNDTFHILGLYYYPNNSIVIFDQSGSTVFQAAPYQNDWDGKDMYNGNLLPQNTYYFLFDLGNGSRKIKGFVYIMRK